MAKTNPIGVRFDEDLLAELKKDGYADSPQRALNLLETYYRFSKMFNSKPIKQSKEILIGENKFEISTPEVYNSEYNFVNEQWLILEKYTKFPNSQKPKTWRSQMEWTKQKRESDQKIIIAWAEFKKDINGQHNI